MYYLYYGARCAAYALLRTPPNRVRGVRKSSMGVAELAPYDVNFCYPVHELENDLVKLTPYIVCSQYPYSAHADSAQCARQPSLHAEPFFQECVLHPTLFDFMPFPQFPTIEHLHEWVEVRVRQDPTLILFAMIDKTKTQDGEPRADTAESNSTGKLAGIIGLIATSTSNLSTEVGLLFGLPEYQGTHVTKTAVALLMDWCFEELGLRRLQWRSHPDNIPSVKRAENMGFRREGVRRWDRLLAPGTKIGEYVPEGRLKPESKSVHVLYLAVCRDDWEDGVKEFVRKIVNCEKAEEVRQIRLH